MLSVLGSLVAFIVKSMYFINSVIYMIVGFLLIVVLANLAEILNRKRRDM